MRLLLSNRKPGLVPAAGAVLLLMALFLLAGCTGDSDEADRLVRESDELRTEAADLFRKSTASIDGLVRGAAAGQALPAGQTKQVSDAAAADLNTALAQLNRRSVDLSAARELSLSDTYYQYLDLLIQSNAKMIESIQVAMEIPRLMAAEQYSLAGWDEIKAQVIVNQIYDMQRRIEQAYSEAEKLRVQAESLKADNPGEF